MAFAQAPAEEDDIRGPRELIEIPVPEKLPYSLWVSIAGGILAVAIAWFLWRKLANKKKRNSPPEVALASLSELAASHDSLAAEAFANRAAQTVRQFISDQFGLAAPKRTTEEFLNDLARQSTLIVSESDHLRVFLKSCDLAKFAGSNLNSTQRNDLIEAARGFVRATSNPAAGGKTA